MKSSITRVVGSTLFVIAKNQELIDRVLAIKQVKEAEHVRVAQ